MGDPKLVILPPLMLIMTSSEKIARLKISLFPYVSSILEFWQSGVTFCYIIVLLLAHMLAQLRLDRKPGTYQYARFASSAKECRDFCKGDASWKLKVHYISEKGSSQISDTICRHWSHLWAAETACFCAKLSCQQVSASRHLQAWIVAARECESILVKYTCLEEHYKLVSWWDLLNRAGEAIGSLSDNIPDTRPQFHQEVSDLQYDVEGLAGPPGYFWHLQWCVLQVSASCSWAHGGL